MVFVNFLKKFVTHSFVKKSEFIEYFFTGPRVEDFVHCSLCKRKSHEICVLYNRMSGLPFHCQRCQESKQIERNSVRAKSLPKTECDIFIDNFLKSHGINKNDSLIIRLLSDMKHVLSVKNSIKDFRTGPDQYQFRNCTLFTFFDTGLESDICFFAVFFQLYGSDCKGPNRNTAYISYIDSVNLLPSENRTKIYRLILLGLFSFLKTKGYSKIYLWSCPPKQNQDYIFYMKPPKMKMPTKERLSKWYVDLFKLGKDLQVIESYVGVQEHSEAENWQSVSDIPYMDGDLWITRIEEAALTVHREAAKLQQETMALRIKVDEAKKAKSNTKRTREMQTRLAKKMAAFQEINKNESLWKMMNVQIRGFTTEYFVIHLSSDVEAKEAEKGETIKRIWLNDRSALVDFLWEFMLEFSTERRAQYSTFIMLYRVFAESSICVHCSKTSAAGLTVSSLKFTKSDFNIQYPIPFQGALLCEMCHKKEALQIPRQLEVPLEFLNFNLTPTVKVKRCRIQSVVNSEHNYAMDVEAPEEEAQEESRESPVTTDSGVGGSPVSSHGTFSPQRGTFSPEQFVDFEKSETFLSISSNEEPCQEFSGDHKISQELSDASDIHLFDSDSDNQIKFFQQQRKQKHRKKHQDLPSRYTRSKCPAKLFDKPEVVAFISLSDGED